MIWLCMNPCHMKIDLCSISMICKEFMLSQDRMLTWILKEEYDMAMGMREVKESLTLEGEQDMRNIEEMKEEGCR